MKDFNFVCNCCIFLLLINAINISISSLEKQIIKKFIDRAKSDSFQIKRYPYLCNLCLHSESRIIVLENMLWMSVKNATITEYYKRYNSNQRQRS